METGMSTTRLVISVVIILGCFTVLYPRFFHPIILQIFGMAPPKQTQSDSIPRRPNMPPGGNRPPHEDIRQHIRPGPHPGMRAAAEMNAQQQTRGSGRGGVMSTVLPMYAVGITVYLVYTLVKVFNKKGNYEKEKERRGLRQKRHSDPYLERGVDRPLTKEEKVQEFVESSQRLNELEELLTRADDKHINEEDMRELQRRLEETESQMARIMQAMQMVTNKVATDADTVPVKENDKPKEGEGDSSPDTSSYEVISNKSDKSSDSSPEVETLKASETPKQETEVTQQKDAELVEADMKREDENEADTVEPVEDIVMDRQKDEEDEDEETNVRQRKGRTASD